MASGTAAGTLQGLTVLLARPVGRAAALRRQVEQAGGRAVLLPTAGLRGSAEPEREAAALTGAATAHAVIFPSASAVRFAYALVPRLRLPAQVIAVGPATAAALRRRGVAALVPALRFDSAGVLALPQLAQVRGKRIAIVTAPGGSDAIASGLVARGARVRVVAVYRRVLPRWNAAHHRRLEAAPAPRMLLLSSVDALQALQRLLVPKAWRRLQRDRVVASSARVADAAHAAGFTHVRIAGSAVTRDLVAAAARWRELPERGAFR